MRYSYNVTLATELKLEDLSGTDKFPYVHVIDTRSSQDGTAFPIAEMIYRRLKNFFIDFDQIPIYEDAMSSRTENNLARCMTEPAGQVLVLTDHPTILQALCHDCNIPFTVQASAVVEDSKSEAKVNPAAFEEAA
jgi:hypothetical protein